MSAKLSKLKISRKTKIIVGIVISVIVVAAVVLGLIIAWQYMFNKNSRFYVVHVNVTSAEGKGKWHGKVEEVMPHVIESKINKVEKSDSEEGDKVEEQEKLFNIFEIDVKKLRTKLESVPEIEKVEVQRVLPNTLDIKVIERIPVAFLEQANSENMVDKDSVVIRKSHCIDITGSIPVIRNLQKKVPKPGEINEEVKPVLEFIRLYKEVGDYAVLEIVEMDLSKEDCVTMKIYYGREKADCYTILNVPLKNPSEGMDRILASITKVKKENPDNRTIDLRFEGQSVVKTDTEKEEE